MGVVNTIVKIYKEGVFIKKIKLMILNNYLLDHGLITKDEYNRMNLRISHYVDKSEDIRYNHTESVSC